jgi:histidinol-phosphatase (PHP family)
MSFSDYHLHSHVSHDAQGKIEEHARRAEEIGLAELCFTEHLDFYPSPDGQSCRTLPSETELHAYLLELQEAQLHTPVSLKFGIELDYKPEADRWVRDLLPRFPFDFVLGSVHNVGPWSVSGPKEAALDYFEKKGAEEGCLEYYGIVEQMVATGLIDSVGHLDIMKRFQPENGRLLLQGQLRDRVVAILEQMAATGTGIEINGSGLVHAPREAYPSLELLKLARQAGVEILTIGSDSHQPATVGRNLAESIALAQASGFTHYYTFAARRPTALPL